MWCEVFELFLISTIFSCYHQCVYFLLHQTVTKIQEPRRQDVGFLLGPKPLPLREESSHKILLIEIPIDEYQDHDPWPITPLQDQLDNNPLLCHYWDHHHCCYIIDPSWLRSLLHTKIISTTITVAPCCTTMEIFIIVVSSPRFSPQQRDLRYIVELHLDSPTQWSSLLRSWL